MKEIADRLLSTVSHRCLEPLSIGLGLGLGLGLGASGGGVVEVPDGELDFSDTNESGFLYWYGVM